MNFTSQICTTKEQSERLLAFGLKHETADMCINPSRELVYPFSYSEALALYDRCGFGRIMEVDSLLPAWSLDRLLKMTPDKISYPTQWDSAPLRINKDSMYYLHRFFDRNGYEDTSTVGDNEAIGSHNIYDYAVSVIGFLIREGYFNKEYLEG